MSRAALAAPSSALVFERVLRHPPAKVWRALTESQLLAQWLLPNDFVAEVGHRFTVRAAPLPGWSGVAHCEVLAVDAPRLLSYRWGNGTESPSGLTTVVTWTLTARPDGTHLRLEQTGFRPTDGLSHARLTAWWTRALSRLSHHL